MSAVPSRISSSAERSADPVRKVPEVVTLRSRTLYDVAKRSLDIALGLIMLVLLLPFALLIAVLIKCDSPGPVFFVNRAVGRYGREFLLYKFRSMRVVPQSEVERTDVINNVLEGRPTTYKDGRPVYKTALAQADRITR